jgi:hypothetical protein
VSHLSIIVYEVREGPVEPVFEVGEVDEQYPICSAMSAGMGPAVSMSSGSDMASEPEQSDDKMDDVLRRMLKTPPTPKAKGKGQTPQRLPQVMIRLAPGSLAGVDRRAGRGPRYGPSSRRRCAPG